MWGIVRTLLSGPEVTATLCQIDSYRLQPPIWGRFCLVTCLIQIIYVDVSAKRLSEAGWRYGRGRCGGDKRPAARRAYLAGTRSIFLRERPNKYLTNMRMRVIMGGMNTPASSHGLRHLPGTIGNWGSMPRRPGARPPPLRALVARRGLPLRRCSALLPRCSCRCSDVDTPLFAGGHRS